MSIPGVVAGSIFAFSLTLGDYIAPSIVGSTKFIGNVIYDNVGVANNLPARRRLRTCPCRDHGHLSRARQTAGRVRGTVMEGRGAKLVVRIGGR